jgi:hypothetical protein
MIEHVDDEHLATLMLKLICYMPTEMSQVGNLRDLHVMQLAYIIIRELH